MMREFAFSAFHAVSCFEVTTRRGMPIPTILVSASAFKPSEASRLVSFARRGLATLLGSRGCSPAFRRCRGSSSAFFLSFLGRRSSSFFFFSFRGRRSGLAFLAFLAFAFAFSAGVYLAFVVPILAPPRTVL